MKFNDLAVRLTKLAKQNSGWIFITFVDVIHLYGDAKQLTEDAIAWLQMIFDWLVRT